MHDVLGLLHHLAFRDPHGRLGHGHGKVVDLDAVELANGDLDGVCHVAQHNLVGEGTKGLIFQFAQGDVRLGQEVAGTTGGVDVPTDFDTIEKAFSGAKAAEKGLK